MEVKASKVDKFSDMKHPGDYQYYSQKGVDGHAGIIFVCPCGKHSGEPTGMIEGKLATNGIRALPFENAPGIGAKWNWNGSEEMPSLTPSILDISECHWHGFLTDGVFRSC